jgi:hypothetical protein
MNKQLLTLLLPIAIFGAACSSDDSSDGDGSGDDAGNGSGDVGTDGGTDAVDDTGVDAGTDTIDDVGIDTIDDIAEDSVDDGSGDTTEDVVVPDEFTISGHVVIRERGVAGIEVQLEVDNGGSWEVVGTTWTEETEGSFSFSELDGGSYRVTPISAQHAYAPADESVELDADRGDLVFSLTASLPPTVGDYWGPTTDLLPSIGQLGGALHARTAYPIDEYDWYRFELSEGSSYEFFTTFVDERNDTEMFIYEGSGDSLLELDDSDDFIDYDSHIAFTPEVSGEYLVAVHHLDGYCHTGTYLFGADVLVDPDEDGYGAWHDCNQDDDRIYPGTDWFESDGSGLPDDWRCDGIVAADPTSDDGFDDNTPATAEPLAFVEFSYEEWIYNYLIADRVRTFSGADEDWFTFTVPAYSKIELHSVLLEGNEPGFEIFEGDAEVSFAGDTQLPSYEEVVNDTDAAKQYYLRLAQPPESDFAGTYLVFGITYGTDADEDSYYTNDYYYEQPDLDDTTVEVTYCSQPE